MTSSNFPGRVSPTYQVSLWLNLIIIGRSPGMIMLEALPGNTFIKVQLRLRAYFSPSGSGIITFQTERLKYSLFQRTLGFDRFSGVVLPELIHRRSISRMLIQLQKDKAYELIIWECQRDYTSAYSILGCSRFQRFGFPGRREARIYFLPLGARFQSAGGKIVSHNIVLQFHSKLFRVTNLKSLLNSRTLSQGQFQQQQARQDAFKVVYSASRRRISSKS